MFKGNFIILLVIVSNCLLANEKSDLLNLWEDDYLMIVLVPQASQKEVKVENERLKLFAEENKDGLGYKNVTAINEPVFKLKDLKLSLSEVLNIIQTFELPKIESINYQGNIVSTNDKYYFGGSQLGLIIEEEDEIISHIWLAKRLRKTTHIKKTARILNKLGKSFDLMLVDYYQNKVVDLGNIELILNYLKLGE